jgi:Rieske Fe-S protein
VNWDEEIFVDEHLPVKPVATGHMPNTTNPRLEAGNWQLRPPIVTNQLAAIKATQGYNLVTPIRDTSGRDRVMHARDTSGRDGVTPGHENAGVHQMAEVKRTVDPFALWTNDSAPMRSMPGSDESEPETPRRAEITPGKPPRKKGRRRVVAMLATGVVAAGIVGVGGLEITRFLQLKQASGNQPATTAQSSTQVDNAVAKPQGGKTQKTMTQAKQQTQKPAQPPKKAPQAAHAGTVIGATNQAANTAKDFKNPADNNASLLVRLSDGTFVAYESACTHQQVPVNYDPATKKFVCPLHGSIFDPAQNGKVLQGPATAPLAAVKVSVNGDGTVTVV